MGVEKVMTSTSAWPLQGSKFRPRIRTPEAPPLLLVTKNLPKKLWKWSRSSLRRLSPVQLLHWGRRIRTTTTRKDRVLLATRLTTLLRHQLLHRRHSLRSGTRLWFYVINILNILKCGIHFFGDKYKYRLYNCPDKSLSRCFFLNLGVTTPCGITWNSIKGSPEMSSRFKKYW